MQETPWRSNSQLTPRAELEVKDRRAQIGMPEMLRCRTIEKELVGRSGSCSHCTAVGRIVRIISVCSVNDLALGLPPVH